LRASHTRVRASVATVLVLLFLTSLLPFSGCVRAEVDTSPGIREINRDSPSSIDNPEGNDEVSPELESVRALLQSIKSVLNETGGEGFYLTYEGLRLAKAEDLVEAAGAALAGGDADRAYADLYEARLILEDLQQTLPGLYTNASRSVLFLTPLLGLTATALASVLFDDRRRRITLSIVLYVLLFGLLYALYPGYRIIQKTEYNPFAGTGLEHLGFPLLVSTSFFDAFLLINVIPGIPREKTSMERLAFLSSLIASFSLAARNLRRRRLRTLLTSIFILVSVFAFITLTSLSFEYGFVIRPTNRNAPIEGFLVQKPSYPLPFDPISPKIPRWLERRPEVALVVPMIENTPPFISDSYQPVAVLSAPKSGSDFEVSGVLGVLPSREVQVTGMDRVVLRGSFLTDSDYHGVLISEEAAEKLQVEPNDTVRLHDQNFTVVGVFDSQRLGALPDLDGEPVLPQVVTATSGDGVEYSTEYAPSEGVVIVHGETARGFPNMVTSRVDVQTRNPGDIKDLARVAVLFWPGVESFASVAGRVYYLFIGSQFVAKGFAATVIPLVLVALNVGVTVMGSVFERRREVTVMSCVGLNPSHITAVFAAEALVMGAVAGSLGYFLSLTSYRFLAVFAVSLGVKQKVEATWGILAITISIAAAVVGSALPAAMASVLTTPSLLKRFAIEPEERPRVPGEPWLFRMPILLQKEDLEKFFGFMRKRLESFRTYRMVDNLRASSERGDPTTTRLFFTYTEGLKELVTENELFPEGGLPGQWAIRLSSKTRMGYASRREEQEVRETASFVRHLILEYTIREKTRF